MNGDEQEGVRINILTLTFNVSGEKQEIKFVNQDKEILQALEDFLLVTKNNHVCFSKNTFGKMLDDMSCITQNEISEGNASHILGMVNSEESIKAVKAALDTLIEALAKKDIIFKDDTLDSINNEINNGNDDLSLEDHCSITG